MNFSIAGAKFRTGTLTDVPVTMTSAYGDTETKRALEGGAEVLLTKPIDFVALRSEIDACGERVA